MLGLAAPIQGHDTPGPDDKVVTAVRLNPTQRIRLDGRLDEPIWQIASPATDFIQRELDFGAPATQRTEVRFCYDERNLYVGARCFDENPDGIL